MANKTGRIRGTTPQVEAAARRLRQNLTPAEALLWSALRGRQVLGLKFRCQHPLDRFILDFYCPAYKLAIEVDGEIHTEQVGYDSARTEQLEEYGYHMLRFSNQEVLENLSSVINEIKSWIRKEEHWD